MGSVGSVDVNFAVGWWEGRRDKSASRLDFGLVILCESRRELPWSSLPIIPVCFAFLILVDDKHLYGCARSCNAEIIVFTFIFAPFCLLVIFFVTSRTLFEVEVWFFFFRINNIRSIFRYYFLCFVSEISILRVFTCIVINSHVNSYNFQNMDIAFYVRLQNYINKYPCSENYMNLQHLIYIIKI